MAVLQATRLHIACAQSGFRVNLQPGPLQLQAAYPTIPENSMPSARDLLQIADALMRSNRNVGAPDSHVQVPVLTDIAVLSGSGVSYRQQRDTLPVLDKAVTVIPAPVADGTGAGDLDTGLSETTKGRDGTIFPKAELHLPSGPGPVPAVLQTEPEPAFAAATMPTSPAETRHWGFDLIDPIPAPISAPAAPAADATSAAELAETVYYQVLQNLDLYTERALQQHLDVHLAPILERASRELLATLHANLGALIRQFVAEAIEKQVGVRPDSSK